MPASCRGIYRRVAILDVEPGTVPGMISERARGVRRIVRTWERCHVGSGGPGTAYGRALAEANELCARLNETGSA